MSGDRKPGGDVDWRAKIAAEPMPLPPVRARPSARMVLRRKPGAPMSLWDCIDGLLDLHERIAKRLGEVEKSLRAIEGMAKR